MITAKDYINYYQLKPHPEGGYYKETYRAPGYISKEVLPTGFGWARNFSTAIYFLLLQNNFSAFHRIQSDECWHFYAGGRLDIFIIHTDGQMETIYLGQNIIIGEKFQHVVPAGCWFASKPAEGSLYSFAGCTVAPGFDFEDFELADAASLIQLYPQHSALIKHLTR